MENFQNKNIESIETSPEEEINPDKMKSILQDVIDDRFEVFDVDTMASYDAIFSEGAEPYFLNIWTIKSGYGFGYIVFHNFLRRVGTGDTFVTTDFTDSGRRLFQKAVNDGLIQQVSEQFGLERKTRWQVVGDPVDNLVKIRDSW